MEWLSFSAGFLSGVVACLLTFGILIFHVSREFDRADGLLHQKDNDQ